MLRKDEEKGPGYYLKCASRRMWKKHKYIYKTRFSQQETVQYAVTFLHEKIIYLWTCWLDEKKKIIHWNYVRWKPELTS